MSQNRYASFYAENHSVFCGGVQKPDGAKNSVRLGYLVCDVNPDLNDPVKAAEWIARLLNHDLNTEHTE